MNTRHLIEELRDVMRQLPLDELTEQDLRDLLAVARRIHHEHQQPCRLRLVEPTEVTGGA